MNTTATHIASEVKRYIADAQASGMNIEDAVDSAIYNVACNTGLEESEVWEVAR